MAPDPFQVTPSCARSRSPFSWADVLDRAVGPDADVERHTESDLAGYNVQYGTLSGSPATTIDVGNVTSRTITGLTAGGTYYFRVVAYNTSGQTSTPSAQVSYTVPGTPAPTSPTLTSVSPASGPTSGGTTITLTGTNFVSGATVRVGGVPATSVTFASSTRSPRGRRPAPPAPGTC